MKFDDEYKDVYDDCDFIEVKSLNDETQTIEPIKEEPKPIIPKPLPVENPISNKKTKQNQKLKAAMLLFVGFFIGVAVLSIGINIGLVSHYSVTEDVNQQLITSYNNGAFFIMNYAMSTGMLPYIEDGELKETKCGALK